MKKLTVLLLILSVYAGFSQSGNLFNSYFGVGVALTHSPLISSDVFADQLNRIEESANSTSGLTYEFVDKNFNNAGRLVIQYAYRLHHDGKWWLNTNFIYGLTSSGTLTFKYISSSSKYSLNYDYRFLRNEIGVNYSIVENDYLSTFIGGSVFANYYNVKYRGYALLKYRNETNYSPHYARGSDKAQSIGFGPTLRFLLKFKKIGVLCNVSYQIFEYTNISDTSSVFAFDNYVKKKEFFVNIILVRTGN